MSEILTSIMKKESSLGITWNRRSKAAGKSSPPSLQKAISGVGNPLAAHSNLALLPSFTVTFEGFLINVGNTERQQCHIRILATTELTFYQLNTYCEQLRSLLHYRQRHKNSLRRTGRIQHSSS